MEELKEKVNVTDEVIKDSVKQGAADFIDDAARLKHSVDEVRDDREAEKVAKRAERKTKFENAMAEIRESFIQGIELKKSSTVQFRNSENPLSRVARNSDLMERSF